VHTVLLRLRVRGSGRLDHPCGHLKKGGQIVRRVSALITALVAAGALAATTSTAATISGPTIAAGLSPNTGMAAAGFPSGAPVVRASGAAVPKGAKAALRAALARQHKAFLSPSAARRRAITTAQRTQRVGGQTSQALVADDHWNFDGCSNWYQTTLYADFWLAAANHWEYNCSWWYEYDSTGLDLADLYGYYDLYGFYGYWYHQPYDCTWWWFDIPTNQWYSVSGC
jgi:hypothetical protein